MRAKIFEWWNQKFQSYKVYLALWSLLYFQSAVTILWWLRMATYCICTVIHVALRFFSLAHTSYQMSDLYLSLTTKVKLYHFSFSTHSLMADLTKNGQTEWMFMDLTILVNFSQICLRDISFKVDLMILMDFSQIPQSAISLADLMTFTIFINACISGHISIYCTHT